MNLYLLCHIAGNDPVFYRWYFRPPNGTFTPLVDGEGSEITVNKPSKANHGYYLCQAYNYRGSIQSRAAKLYVLKASTMQFSFMANFSINWFALENDTDIEGSGFQSINVTDRNIIMAALESALNSSNITIELDSVIDRPGGSQVEVRIFGICATCDLLNYSLANIENSVMNLSDELSRLVMYLNQGIINRQFIVAGSSDTYIRMQIVMATASNVSSSCPQTMSISRSHFFICGEYALHNSYFNYIVILICIK